jgi:hypothetical protein
MNERGARRYALLHVICVLTKVTHDNNFTLEPGGIRLRRVAAAPGWWQIGDLKFCLTSFRGVAQKLLVFHIFWWLMNSMRVVSDKQGDYLPCEEGGDNAEPTENKTDYRNVSILWVLMSGAGFLADAYDLFVINIAVDIMARCSHEQPLTIAMISTVKSMAVAGAIVGQIAFGSLADIIDRRRIFIITCYLVMVGSVLSGLAVDSRTFGIYSQIATWRFVLGVGIGGEYPLSAAITAESSRHGSEIRNLAMVQCAPLMFLIPI